MRSRVRSWRAPDPTPRLRASEIFKDPKAKELAMAATEKPAALMHGTVKFFDVFVHVRDLVEPGVVPQPGDRVRFDTQRTYRGTRAISVERDTGR